VIKKLLNIREEPWIPPKAKQWLSSFLKPDMVIFEYGSGGSTIFFARRAKNIISVEYQLLWYFGVLLALLRRRIINFRLILSRPERIGSLEEKYMSSDANIKDLSFKKFVTTINKFPDHFFDLVFVDGRARIQCIEHSISKVKTGGYILLDDSNRTIYNPGKKLLSGFKKTNLGTTTAWKII